MEAEVAGVFTLRLGGWGLAVAAVALAAPVQAQAPSEPVAVRVDGIFGDELVVNERMNTFLVTATNRTPGPLRGELRLLMRAWSGVVSRHVSRVDLPGNESRVVQFTVPLPEGVNLLGGVEATFVSGRATLGRGGPGGQHSYGQEGLVVLSDPPRIRSNLLEMQIVARDRWGSLTHIAPPVGEVSFDSRSGDPILPERAAGWSPVSLLVADVPTLLRATPRARRALVQWLQGGGQALLFPRSPADLADPFVVQLLGRVTVEEVAPDGLALVPAEPGGEESTEQGNSAARDPFVPDGAPARALRGEGLRTDGFGASRRLGFGRVFVASYDGAGAEHAASPAVRGLVHALVTRPLDGESGPPLLPPGAVVNDTDRFGGGGPMPRDFSRLRAALDPNEAYKPVLLLAALVLLVYVVLVGPVNFMWVERSRRPVLALVTTPALAVGCLFVLLLVGYVSKGPRSRYLSASVWDVVEGDHIGVANRFSGLFLTRPRHFDLAGDATRLQGVLHKPSGGVSYWFDHSDGSIALKGLHGQLWETLFVEDSGTFELGGAVHFELDGNRLSAVRNASPRALRGAVVVDPFGQVYPVGDVAPGATAAVPTASRLSLSSGWLMGESPELVALQQIMNLPEETKETLGGVISVTGGTITAGQMPVLLAWLDIPPGPELAGIFKADRGQCFLRVVPDVDLLPAAPAMVPTKDLQR